MKWVIVLLAVLNFGYMAFDGGRALIKGSYITPSSGKHAGQLGPWSKLANSIGIDPEGTLMKIIFVVWGIAGLIITWCFLKDPAQYWKWMLIVNIFSLWYAMAGTASSIIQIILLVIMRFL